MTLADEPIAVSAPTLNMQPGRRLRVFMRLLTASINTAVPITYLSSVAVPAPPSCNYREALAWLTEHQATYPLSFPLRVGSEVNTLFNAVPEKTHPVNAELHQYLQDLADTIIIDVVDACAVISDPDLYYPGIDEGIEPVTDDHVKLVMWGINRELYREQARLGKPAPTLGELPWRIQRALAERRRLRYQQWGLGKEEYESNSWSPWNIPEDPDWVPVRVLT